MDPAAVPHDIEVGPRPDREAEAGVRAEVPRDAVVLRVEGQNDIGREGEDGLLLPELLDEVPRRQTTVDVERFGFELQSAGAGGPAQIAAPFPELSIVEPTAGVRAAVTQGSIGARVGLQAPALKMIRANRDGHAFRDLEGSVEPLELRDPVGLEPGAGR